MKELFKKLSNLFNFGKENRLVNETGGTVETGKDQTTQAPVAPGQIPSAQDAPAQVDTDVANTVAQGDDLGIPPPVGGPPEEWTAEKKRTLDEAIDRGIAARKAAVKDRGGESKEGIGKAATIEPPETKGVVGDAGKPRGRKIKEVKPRQPKRPTVKPDEAKKALLWSKRGERDSVREKRARLAKEAKKVEPVKWSRPKPPKRKPE